MRALLKDGADGTFIVLEVEQVCYDEQARELYLASTDYEYCVPRIIRVNADSVIRELFETGKSDLTCYEAMEANS